MDIRILLCDDNRYQLSRLEHHIKEYSSESKYDFIIDKSLHSKGALELFDKGKYQMIFLDIDLSDRYNGIELAKKIRQVDHHVLIIFVTAFSAFAYEAYEVFAFNYIVKPINPIFFHKMMDRAVDLVLSRYYMKEKLSITVKNANENYVIFYDEIIYAEKLGKRMHFYLTDGREITGVMTISYLEAHLEKDYFIRCHKSFIINRYKIRSVEKDYIIMRPGNIEVPLGRKFKEEVDRAILEII